MANGPLIWVLTDGRAGTRTQALGVAEACGLPFVVKELAYAPLARLPGGLLGRSFLGLTPEARAGLAPPWPDAVIAAGRRAATVARAIKRKARGATVLLQIMLPRGLPLGDFDIIAAPEHDSPPDRPNILPTVGAPHRVTGTQLREAADAWESRVADLPQPLIAVFLGGSTRRREFPPALGVDLGQRVNAIATVSGGTLLVSTSPRTGADLQAAFLSEIRARADLHLFGAPEPNPYLGFLAHANFIVVTGDSVSMCCEACAAPGSTYIFAPAGLVSDRHARLHRSLFEKGFARPFVDGLEAWPHRPLNEARRIAQALLEHLGVS